MKIKIDFTLEVAPEKLAALREFCCSENNDELRNFLHNDVINYIVDYIEANVCDVKASRNMPR